MAAKDRTTRIQEKVTARAARVQQRMKLANPIGLGREELSHVELQDRIRNDQATRDEMLERMGPDVMLDYMGTKAPDEKIVRYEE